jgi:hypothetical protein
MRPPLSSRKNNPPGRVASAETFVRLIWGTVMMRPFVSLPLEMRLNLGRGCVPPGSGLVDHREGIGKPAVGAKELPSCLVMRTSRVFEYCVEHAQKVEINPCEVHPFFPGYIASRLF